MEETKATVPENTTQALKIKQKQENAFLALRFDESMAKMHPRLPPSHRRECFSIYSDIKNHYIPGHRQREVATQDMLSGLKDPLSFALHHLKSKKKKLSRGLVTYASDRKLVKVWSEDKFKEVLEKAKDCYSGGKLAEASRIMEELVGYSLEIGIFDGLATRDIIMRYINQLI